MSSKILKWIFLELGGKNVVIVLKDVDLDKVVEGIVKLVFMIMG